MAARDAACMRVEGRAGRAAGGKKSPGEKEVGVEPPAAFSSLSLCVTAACGACQPHFYYALKRCQAMELALAMIESPGGPSPRTRTSSVSGRIAARAFFGKSFFPSGGCSRVEHATEWGGAEVICAGYS